MTLSEMIAKAIRESGFTAREIAIYSTVDKAVILRFMSGERTITLETAHRIVSALGCAVSITQPTDKVLPTMVTRKRKKRK